MQMLPSLNDQGAFKRALLVLDILNIPLIYKHICTLNTQSCVFKCVQLFAKGLLCSQRTRRERQSGRKSLIFNESRRRAPARAARLGWWERRGELKSAQLYGNELWRGWAATNQNVEVLRLKGFQRTQPINFGSDHISSQTKWRRS